MSDRAEIIADFLKNAGWARAAKFPLAGDMSARRYVRLIMQNGDSAILMDAPPDVDGSTPKFAFMAAWLAENGISAPRIYSGDPEEGILLLEDFGDAKFTDLIARDPAGQHILYHEAIRLLIAIRQFDPPPLAKPTAGEMADWTRIADRLCPDAESFHFERFRANLETHLASILTTPTSVSLRDFHADNMIWLENREGIQRVGILDFQDAFLTHPVYDLVSLLSDARTEVSRDLREQMIDFYVSECGDDPSETRLAFAVLSVQRNLRILGIFAPAAEKHSLMPRVSRYLSEALAHPALSDLRESFTLAFPLMVTDNSAA